MENIIKKATEGGWNSKDYIIEPKHFGRYLRMSNDNRFIEHLNTSGDRDYWEDLVSTAEFFCDPAFWQALGKACEWYKEEQLVYIIPKDQKEREASIYVEDNLGIVMKVSSTAVSYIPYKKGNKTWKEHALIFHEINLTESFEKAVEYLSELIEKSHA